MENPTAYYAGPLRSLLLRTVQFNIKVQMTPCSMGDDKIISYHPNLRIRKKYNGCKLIQGHNIIINDTEYVAADDRKDGQLQYFRDTINN